MEKTFSLRAHAAPVSGFCAWENQLVSADRSGTLIVWNLSTRRPAARFRAHEGQVLSMQPTRFGLLTHGRDSAVRIWPPGAAENSKGGDPHPIFEMPVNALNFCNVAYIDGADGTALLATPASVDSDCFDVYRLSPEFSLARAVENQAPKREQRGADHIEEIGASPGRGEGIIMRLAWAAPDLLYVGYESGALASFSLSPEGCRMLWLARAHSPHPVLSLALEGARVYSGSAAKTLLIHEPPHEEAVAKHNLGHYGVQCFEILPHLYLAGFWDGSVAGFSRGWQQLFCLERPHEQIEAPESPSRKSLCLFVWSAPAAPEHSRRDRLRSRRAAGRLLFVGHADGLIVAYAIDESSENGLLES
ncbi:putative ASTRA-associated protein [Clavispora lusitaniae]|uniref:ASTRA-associated protein 1 n=1 Tax=Clavispora lusitaniae TaxID=36911 RepID=A0AA91PWN9_CLALS|nr:putative ASTRA-associated protein [Clavispora lusitaniae]